MTHDTCSRGCVAALPPRWYLYDAYSCSIVQILKELHKSCQKEDGTDDQKKGTQLLEVYAIEIQMYTETKNNKKLKVTSTWTLNAFYLVLLWLNHLLITWNHAINGLLPYLVDL